jgi:hypothetical protein
MILGRPKRPRITAAVQTTTIKIRRFRKTESMQERYCPVRRLACRPVDAHIGFG